MTFIHSIPSSLSDAELISQFKDNCNTEALGALYDRYMQLVFGVCLKYLADSETAKDAVMDIFAELVDKLKKHEVDNFRSWLYSVAKNHCLMKLRSGSRAKNVNFEDNVMQLHAEMHLPDGDEKEWQLDRLSECMEILAADQKRVIDMFYLQEKCYKEIAELSGFEWNRVRSLVQNGRRNLKICMDGKEIKAAIVKDISNKNG